MGSSRLSGTKANRPLSYADIEAMTKSVRLALGIQRSCTLSPLELFEIVNGVPIGQLLPQRVGLGKIPIWTGVSGEGEGYAHFVHEKGSIEISVSEATYLGLIDSYPRAAYTLCHELGHALLHPIELIKLAALNPSKQAALHRGRKQHRAFEDTEWQANAFAGALLMPAIAIAELERLYRVLTAELISQRFHVSIDAASYRLNIFNAKRGVLLA